MSESALICPKCQGQMRTYERNGVQVDQCGECRGIFLDRGELERLMDAESAYMAGGRGGDPQQLASQGHHGGGHSSSGYGGKKRRESFLGDLFG